MLHLIEREQISLLIMKEESLGKQTKIIQ